MKNSKRKIAVGFYTYSDFLYNRLYKNFKYLELDFLEFSTLIEEVIISWVRLVRIFVAF